MDIREHGLFVVNQIVVEPVRNRTGARVIAHGRTYPTDPEAIEVSPASKTIEIECSSHVEVQATIADLLTHTAWWDVA